MKILYRKARDLKFWFVEELLLFHNECLSILLPLFCMSRSVLAQVGSSFKHADIPLEHMVVAALH